jgi:tetratricopeptide (TPR) repeat protein
MARAGVPCAVGRKKEIAKQLQTIVDDTKRRYALWSLARYYGYIRSAEMFARMGYAWAHSALPGAAIANVQRAQALVPADRQNGLLNMLAQAYATDNNTQKSRELYLKVLAGDADNHDAHMGLMRLALQKGDYAEAMKHLEKAVSTAKSAETAGFDWALLHMMNNDLGKARLSLQKVTDLQPKSLQAWSLLAGVLLQQHDQAKTPAEKKKAMDEIEMVILPKMQSLAETPRDYYLQMTRALVFMRKGAEYRKEARDALVVASSSRPDVAAVGDMILNLDIQLVDAENAEKHARQILRQNRRNKLANYVMGSIRLQRGDLATAETFLRISVADEKPMASAQNDLAETLRRQKKYADAEKVARDAVKNDPKLYVAWETLASILLDQNKNVAEAEECVKKAIDLVKAVSEKGDLRMLITLARAQLAKGDTVHFNQTARTLNGRRKELSPFDRQALEELQQRARASRR